MLSKLFKKQDQQENTKDPNGEKDTFAFQERPKICLINMDTNVIDVLESSGFNCTPGSLGAVIRTPNNKVGDRCFCRSDYDIPPNLHEFDIVVFDLDDRDPIEYDIEQHENIGGKGPIQFIFECEFPQTFFDQRPLTANVIKSTIRDIQRKESVVIVFANSREDSTYQPIEIGAQSHRHHETIKIDNYAFIPILPRNENKVGVETEVVTKSSDLVDLLNKYKNEFVYGVIFHHPSRMVDGEDVKSSNFFPLIVNSTGEIVSYAQEVDQSLVIVFPQLENKSEFIAELFRINLPAIVPNLFPYSTQFAWVAIEEYRLPNENELIETRERINQEYHEKITMLQERIENNRQKYQFLHKLLTDTGESLVDAVEQYLRWLEFDDVLNCDKVVEERKEEDLRVSFGDELLVVEVKGIVGTSKDSECSQISKIKYRRARERDAFDVFALYIVNHQRYMPPESRMNPPFTDQQIKDAESDERGLLTTYELFKLFFMIDSGIVRKEDVRDSLLNFGLIAFYPSNAEIIGKPLEIHYNGEVGIFILNNINIRLGDELLVNDMGKWRKIQVVTLRDQDKDVSEAREGEIGIKFSQRISTESELWKQIPSNE